MKRVLPRFFYRETKLPMHQDETPNAMPEDTKEEVVEEKSEVVSSGNECGACSGRGLKDENTMCSECNGTGMV